MSDPQSDVPRWITKELTTLQDCAVFDVVKRHCERPAEADAAAPATHDYFFLDCADFVNVVALTADDQVLLVEQWRAGVNDVTLEVPGGLVDTGETTQQAAERELLEETGYRGRAWHPLGVCQPNPAIQNNVCATWLVRDVVEVARPQFDTTEHCRLHVVPFAEALRMVADGRIRHALVIVALHHEMSRRLSGGTTS